MSGATEVYLFILKKAELRKIYLEKRLSLDAEMREQLSLKILGHFSTLPFTGIRNVHFYHPITQKQEFNSLLLASWMKKNHPDVQLILPKSNLTTATLTNWVWTSETLLAVNKWGITEPQNGVQIDPKIIDLVVLPLLAFDIDGNRVGYGKGFYDRFLSECRADVAKVGISFFEPVSEITDSNALDVKLDLCITPQNVWKFKP